MNPYALKNAGRLKYFSEAVLESIRVSEHNALVEQRIKENGDADGYLHRQYERPRFDIQGLLVMAQITDNEDDPMMDETYFIQEGEPVLFQDDGAKNTAAPFRDLPPVMFL